MCAPNSEDYNVDHPALPRQLSLVTTIKDAEVQDSTALFGATDSECSYVPFFWGSVQDYDVDHPVLPLQPPLDYTAPELTRPLPLSARAGGLDARLSVDLFSLGLFTYHLVTKKALLRCNNNADTVSIQSPALGDPTKSVTCPPLVSELWCKLQFRAVLPWCKLQSASVYCRLHSVYTSAPSFQCCTTRCDATSGRFAVLLRHGGLHAKDVTGACWVRHVCVWCVQYHSRVMQLRNLPLNEVPMDLEPELRRMLNTDPAGRPTASDFAGGVLPAPEPRFLPCAPPWHRAPPSRVPHPPLCPRLPCA